MKLSKIISNKSFASQKGFTLIEILIVVSIIAALAVSVFVALNPAQRLKDAKDARRTADVDSILSAVHAAIVDNKGALPTALAGIPVDTDVQLGTGLAAACSPVATGGCSVAASTACVNLMTDAAVDLIPYLKTMPVSPQSGTTVYADANTGYAISRDANGIITVKACGTEGATPIASSR